ncbi:MAG: N-acyl-D-amino-acid deacylase family protein [Vicinamibacteria bacterium]
MRAEVLIKNGRILDGTGAPEEKGDLVIAGGKIAALGRVSESVDADEVVEASGKVVAPGFIDIHSHGDLVLAWPADDRLALIEGRVAQGITTEIVGNCGLGAVPLFGAGLELLPRINGWMTPAPFEWVWSGVDEYLRHLEGIGIAVNVGTLVPHGPLRLGAQALSSGDTTEGARKVMLAALDAALEEGAFGLSAGLIYPPGMYTSTEELSCLAERVARHDRVFTCHIRGSSETLLDAVSELVQIGREAGVHVHHSHAEAVGRSHWSRLSRFLQMEDEAREEGVRVSADMFPYTVAATMMLAIFPPWSLEGGLPRLIERLTDTATRERIRRDIDTVSPEWPPWKEGGWPHNLVKAVGWDRIRVSTVGSERNRAAEGSSLQELGRARGQDPFDAVADLMIEEEGNVGQFVEDISGEDGLRTLVSRPEIAFVTDANDYGKGKPHPAAYGSFPRVLGRYVRRERLLALPEAVRRMTSLPAEILGIENRGILKAGAFADVVTFDADVIEDLASLEEPRRKAKGIDRVFVNGRCVYRNSSLTGAVPGMALRAAGRSP